MRSVVFLAASLSLLIVPQVCQAQGLSCGSSLAPGTKITSSDGQFTLELQDDGNLVWSQGNTAIWSSGTHGIQHPVCKLQEDGNLVIYGTRDGKSGAIWASNTSKRKGASLVCQSDGNLVIYQKSKPIWASNTVVARTSTGTNAKVPQAAIAGGSMAAGGALGYLGITLSGMTAVGAVGSGAGAGMAAGPSGAIAGSIVGLAGYGAYRVFRR